MMDDRRSLEWRIFVLESTLRVTEGCNGSGLTIPSAVRCVEGQMIADADGDSWRCELVVSNGEPLDSTDRFVGRGQSVGEAMYEAVVSMRVEFTARLSLWKSQLSSLGTS